MRFIISESEYLKIVSLINNNEPNIVQLIMKDLAVSDKSIVTELIKLVELRHCGGISELLEVIKDGKC